MKILYLSYDGMTDPLGQSQVLPYLCELSKLGYEIHLISFEKKEAFANHELLIKKITDDAQIRWYPQSYTKFPPVVSTLQDIYQMLTLAKTLHKKHHFSLVHCRSYISAWVGLELKKHQNIPFLFDMRGFWADERVEGNIWNLKNPIYKIIYNYFKKKELEYITYSDAIVSLTHAAKTEIESWETLNNLPLQNKIVVIPCCADLNHFNSKDPNLTSATRKNLGFTENDLVISYVGSIGTWYLIDEMFQLFKSIQKTYPNAKFLILTNHKKTEVEQYLSKAQISPETVTILAGKRAEMPLLISVSNISVFFVKPSFSKKASSPTKMGELMGCGIPLICNINVGDVEKIMHESEAGICISSFAAESYEEIVRTIPQLLSLDSNKIRSQAEKFYSLQNGVDSYAKIYEKIIR
ncbi:MAG: glycosyltransferase [Cytophagales bacterium]